MDRLKCLPQVSLQPSSIEKFIVPPVVLAHHIPGAGSRTTGLGTSFEASELHHLIEAFLIRNLFAENWWEKLEVPPPPRR